MKGGANFLIRVAHSFTFDRAFCALLFSIVLLAIFGLLMSFTQRQPVLAMQEYHLRSAHSMRVALEVETTQICITALVIIQHQFQQCELITVAAEASSHCKPYP